MVEKRLMFVAVLVLLIAGTVVMPVMAAEFCSNPNKNYLANLPKKGEVTIHFQVDDNQISQVKFDNKSLAIQSAHLFIEPPDGQFKDMYIVLNLTPGNQFIPISDSDLSGPLSGRTLANLKDLMDFNLTSIAIITPEGDILIAPIIPKIQCVLPEIIIEGFVFNDTNRDGVWQELLEEGIEGVQVQVETPLPYTYTTTTHSTGYFLFTDLTLSGDYAVSITVPSGYTNTTPKSYTSNLDLGQTASFTFGLALLGAEITVTKEVSNDGISWYPADSVDALLPIQNEDEVWWRVNVTDDGLYQVSISEIVDKLNDNYDLSDEIRSACFEEDDIIEAGETLTCLFSTDVISGQNFNNVSISACSNGHCDSDNDPAYYYGYETIDEIVNITVYKDVSTDNETWEPADYPSRYILINAGESVYWRIIVANNGALPLTIDTVTDLFNDQEPLSGLCMGPGEVISPGEILTCHLETLAAPDLNFNNITVDACYAIGEQRFCDKDSDRAYYYGILPGTAVIMGTAFEDSDGNGFIDSGEAGIPEINVTLEISGEFKTVITDEEGTYVFYNQPMATPFAINATLPEGYFRTTSGTVYNSTDIAEQIINFGYAPVESEFGVIYGTVFEDEDHDGIRSFSEFGIPDVTVQLNTSSGLYEEQDVLNPVTTNNLGQYTLRTSIADTYFVVESDLPEFVSTTPNNVTTDIVIGSSGDSPVDFGDFHGAVIMGMVFDDTSVNGEKESTEGGVAGAVVSAGSDSFTTGADGIYTLYVNATGNVYINETDPAGYVSTNAVPGSGVERVDANSLRIPEIEWGKEYAGNEFGDVAASGVITIAGYVINDKNANGIKDSGDEGLPGAVVGLSSGLSQTIGSDGGFLLYGPADQIVFITEINPAGYISTNAIPGNNARKISHDNISVNGTDLPYSDIYQTRASWNNFFFDAIESSVAIINGTVFNDTNENGFLDTGEAGFPDVNVTMEISGGIQIPCWTDSAGKYQFAIPIGTAARITSEGPGGAYYPTTPESVPIKPPEPGTYPDNNFGYSDDPGKVVIYGIVFDDTNEDGNLDLGELGLSGANVTLDGTKSFITSCKGLICGTFGFNFTDIGAHALHEENPSGYRSTTPDDVNVDVAMGNSYSVDFGDTNKTGTASIYGTVFDDCNGNGSQDSIEPGIEGVEINLTNADGIEIQNTTTGDYGQYTFAISEPGNFSVYEQRPARVGYHSTTPDEVRVQVQLDSAYVVNFGDTPCGGASFFGTVYNDTNANGIWDLDEFGLPGVNVTMSAQDARTIVTNEWGQYTFLVGEFGVYTITQENLPGRISTNATPGSDAVIKIDNDTLEATVTALGRDFGNNLFGDAIVPYTTLSVSKSALDLNGSPLVILDTVQYTWTIINTGDFTAFNVELTDQLPENITCVNVSARIGQGEKYSIPCSDTVVWTIPSLPSLPAQIEDTKAFLYINVTINTEAENTTIINTGMVEGSNFDPPTPPEVCPDGSLPVEGKCPAPGVFDIDVIKEVSGTVEGPYVSANSDIEALSIPAGAPVFWRITVTNTGDFSATLYPSDFYDDSENLTYMLDPGFPGFILGPGETFVSGYSHVQNPFFAECGLHHNTITVEACNGSACVTRSDSAYYEAAPEGYSIISGIVFNDENGNGIWDKSENGIPSVNVTMHGVATLQTDLSGRYHFIAGETGVYTIIEEDPDNYRSTTPNEIQVKVGPDECHEVNFGDVQDHTQFSSIFGTVYYDANNNRARETGELGMDGVSVILAGDGLSGTSITKDYGTYTFRVDNALLPPEGSIPAVVSEIIPDGYVNTTPAEVTSGIERFESYNIDFGLRVETITPPPKRGGGSGTAPAVSTECDFYEIGTLSVNEDGLNLRTITICAIDGIGKLIVYKGSLGSYSDGGPLTWASIIPEGDIPAYDDGCDFTGYAYNIGPAQGILDPVFTITMEFSPQEWAEFGDSDPVIRYWNTVTGTWEDIPTIADATEYMIRGDGTTLGIYALFACEETVPPVIEPPIIEPTIITTISYINWMGLLTLWGIIICITLGTYREGALKLGKQK